MEIKKYFIYILFFVIGILTFSTSNISKIIVEIRQEENKIDKNISPPSFLTPISVIHCLPFTALSGCVNNIECMQGSASTAEKVLIHILSISFSELVFSNS